MIKTFLRNIFGGKNAATVSADINQLIIDTEQRIASPMSQTMTQRKLDSLSKMNDDMSVATAQVKEVTSALVMKLNRQVDGLTKQIKAISDASIQGIVTLDYTGKVININASIESMFRYPAQELIGKYVSVIIPLNVPGIVDKPIDFPNLMKSVSENIFSNIHNHELNINNYFSLSTLNRRLVGKTKDGKRIYIDLNVNITNPNIDKVEDIQYICVMSDVSELIQTQHSIEDMVNFQLSLVEAIPNPVYWKDKNFRYLGCNSSFEKLSGFKREDIIGKTVEDLIAMTIAIKSKVENIHEFDNEEIMKIVQSENDIRMAVQEYTAGKAAISSIKRSALKTKIFNVVKKEYRDIMIYRSPIFDRHGDFNGIVCSVMDITQVQKDLDNENTKELNDAINRVLKK